MTEVFEGVIYWENFKIGLYRKGIEKLFAFRQKYTDEGSDLVQNLAKLIMNSLYGNQLRKDINESYKCISQHWMEKVYDDNVFHYWRLPIFSKIENRQWFRKWSRCEKHITKSLDSFYFK